MAGATVLRGPLGFGRSSVLHTEKILRLSQDLPVVIEIVDADEKIGGFISEVMALTKSCLITTEKVRIIRYGEGDYDPRSRSYVFETHQGDGVPQNRR